MSKHTSGPWWQGNAFSRPTSDGATVYAGAIASRRAISVLVSTGYAGEAAAVANTRLASAAPEMLTACKMQQRLIEDMMRFVGKMALRDYALLNDAPIAARAAIAKATGEGE